MSKYSSSFKSFSETVFSIHGEKIKQWAKETGNPELSESCRMILEAAKGG